MSATSAANLAVALRCLVFEFSCLDKHFQGYLGHAHTVPKRCIVSNFSRSYHRYYALLQFVDLGLDIFQLTCFEELRHSPLHHMSLNATQWNANLFLYFEHVLDSQLINLAIRMENCPQELFVTAWHLIESWAKYRLRVSSLWPFRQESCLGLRL